MIQIKPFVSPYEYVQITKPQGHSLSLRAGEVLKAEVVDILPSGGVVLRLKGSYITVRTEIPLQKDTSLLLKILELPTRDNRLKIQLLSVFDNAGSISINTKSLKDISELSLLKIISQDIEQMNEFEKIVFSEIVRSKIKNVPVYSLPESIVFKEISPETLRSAVNNSGIFLETKLKKLLGNKKVDLKNDIKAVLLKEIENTSILGRLLGDSKQKKELLNDILLYQLLSRLTNSIYTYVPLILEGLEKFDISYKKDKKGNSFVKLDFTFKEKGRVLVLITYFEKYLNLFFKFENEDFQKQCEENISQLKEKLKDFNLSIHFFNSSVSFDTLETFEISNHLLEMKI